MKDVEEAIEAPPADGQLLAYDFYKHMSSLSLVALGGVLTIGASVFGEQVSQRFILLSAILIALSGAVAFKCQVDIVRERNGLAVRMALREHGLKVVAATFGGGIGAFLYVTAQSVF